jgi:hypothetical protein
MKIKKSQLRKSHNRNDFDCGEEPLNDFLKQQARQADERNLVRTWVIEDAASPGRVLSFYSTSPCEILPPKGVRGYKGYPHDVPFLRLTRLATDLRYTKMGFGEIALLSAVADVVAIHSQTAIGGLVVDAKDEQAANFYRRYDLIPLDEPARTFYLPINDCIALANEMDQPLATLTATEQG